MVLQRAPARANLWGWSKTPGSTVTIKFNQKNYEVQASGPNGAWSSFLEPTKAGGPYTITITSSAGESQTLQNVLFGDVYVCSGQSNMQMTVDSVFNASDEVKAANNYPHIRVFTVGQGTSSPTPLVEFATVFQKWSVASASSIGVGNWSAFSATCWFFGRDLYEDLQVPIGLFSTNWGGTIVQAWSSPEALTKCKASEEESLYSGKVGGPNDPSNLWNAMIVPILPMTIKGATWYQGESNSGQPNYYACAFPVMISDWRAKWGGDTMKDFGFYYVQLAPWLANGNDAEALTRLSQVYANALPRVGVATAMDLGDPTSPYNDIHPRSKQPVGARLALVARLFGYQENIQAQGPEADKWQIVSDAPSAQVRVSFKRETIGTGLVSVAKQCYPEVPPAQCVGFEIGINNGAWVKAVATIHGNDIIVSAQIPAGSHVAGVRYGWANFPLATLYNNADLPALPFAFPNPIKPTKAW